MNYFLYMKISTLNAEPDPKIRFYVCTSLCSNLLLLSKQQEEIMCYASFIVLLQFKVSQSFLNINAFPCLELVIISNNLSYATHDTYHTT